MENANQLRDVERFLHERIPLTRAMGVRTVSYDDTGFVVAAPVALNSNHLNTAFGGSINAVATLAGYGFLWLTLRDEAVDVVIRDSSIRFLHPLRETITAFCERPDVNELASFRAQVRSKGKARIRLRVQVREEGAVAAELQATFVALRKST